MKNKLVLNERYQQTNFYFDKAINDKVEIRNKSFYDLSFCSGVLILGHQSKILSKTLRDFNNNVVVNEHLSSISTSFSTLSTNTFRTLRFRYVNLGQKLYIDYHDSDTTTYSSLTTIDLGFRFDNYSNLDNIYCGFSFTTPVSTTAVDLSAKEFFLRNFHTEGYVGYTILTETVTSEEIPVNPNTTRTTVDNITARPV